MKKTFLLLIVCTISVQSFALTSIYTKKVLNGPHCPGASVVVGYLVDAAASSGNVFTAQLSDENGDFSSPVNIGSIVKTTNGNISCTIPLGLSTGTKYKIRVVSSSPAVIGSPCENKVSINPKPKSLSLSGVTACQATLNWESVTTAASYKVRYRLTGGEWSEATDVGTNLNYTFNGLNASSSYDFQVRSVCASGEKSDWSKTSSSTLVCPVPTNLIVTDVGLTTSSLNWADASCSSGYLFQYRAFGEPTWIGPLTTTSSDINLTGLFAATLYEAQVANDCGATNSAWSGSSIWETEYFRVAGDAELFSSVNVFPNPSGGDFVVSYNSAAENVPVEVNVQNMYGQVVFSNKKQSAAGLNEDKIELRNATAGLYFVSVKYGDKEFKTSLLVK